MNILNEKKNSLRVTCFKLLNQMKRNSIDEWDILKFIISAEAGTVITCPRRQKT
jgi:hypothetical protein